MADKKKSKKKALPGNMHWSREGVESIVVAIMLALLFRAFEAEAFVIPTGSMAPTLQGQHKDVACPECRCRYRAGASPQQQLPAGTTNCPMCRRPQQMDRFQAAHATFSGDRILVNKFAYQFGDPERWDVIVFKFPGNAKQNYIKRLVGLPGETLRILHGDVFSKPTGSDDFTILRKSPGKLTAMLQLVHSTSFIPDTLVKADWPQAWSDLEGSGSWTTSEDRKTYTLQSADQERWIRYRHIMPNSGDWTYLTRGQSPPDAQRRNPALVTDFYAYNHIFPNFAPKNADERQYYNAQRRKLETRNLGLHWVGDLAVECVAEVKSQSGVLALDLVEAGVHFLCRIDTATGKAELTIDGDANFEATDNKAPERLTAATSVSGPGRYRIRFANADDRIYLWVGSKCVEWHANDKPHPGHIVSAEDRPVFREDDPADAAPIGIGGKDIDLIVSKIRVLRDIYYVAAKSRREISRNGTRAIDYKNPPPNRDIASIFSDPSVWETTKLFDDRGLKDFELEKFPGEKGRDQYFPMGDNNPHSKDARLWTQQSEASAYDGKMVEIDHFVERDLLIGKAFLVYWPHGWNIGNIRLPIIPNVQRMGRIR